MSGGSLTTWSVAVAWRLGMPISAWMVAVPPPAAVARPDTLIVATSVSELHQAGCTGAVVPSEKVAIAVNGWVALQSIVARGGWLAMETIPTAGGACGSSPPPPPPPPPQPIRKAKESVAEKRNQSTDHLLGLLPRIHPGGGFMKLPRGKSNWIQRAHGGSQQGIGPARCAASAVFPFG